VVLAHRVVARHRVFHMIPHQHALVNVLRAVHVRPQTRQAAVLVRVLRQHVRTVVNVANRHVADVVRVFDALTVRALKTG